MNKPRIIATGDRNHHNVANMELVWLKVPQWEQREGFVHGFFGRKGGKSLGAYASLNLSVRVGDDIQTVKDNLCDLKKAVGLHDERVVTMTQMHKDHIAEVSDKRTKDAGPADGMITEQKEMFLGVLTADCLPILISVPSRRLTAVVHAGWRGTLAGITTKMVAHFQDRFQVAPESLEVALGPAIGPCCYEVQADVTEPLLANWKGLAEACIHKKNGSSFVDLKSLNKLQLQEAGVPPDQLYSIGPCTACTPEEFYSYRRDGYGAKSDTGRQLSFAGWF